MEKHVGIYLNLMHEVKRRHLSLETAYLEPHRLLFKAISIDHCYLQLRKILELVAFSVLSSNQRAISQFQQGKSREYNADKILKSIELKFGAVYPRPIHQQMNPAPGIKVNFANIEKGYLTREEFSELYAECGNVLHTRNPFRKPLDPELLWSRIPEWSAKIRILLNSHIATIVSDPHLYLVQMANGDKPPTVTIFERQTQ